MKQTDDNLLPGAGRSPVDELGRYRFKRGRKTVWFAGEVAWFEHLGAKCGHGPENRNWRRSHSAVTVLAEVAPERGYLPIEDPARGSGTQYIVVGSDRMEFVATLAELLTSPKYFQAAHAPPAAPGRAERARA